MTILPAECIHVGNALVGEGPVWDHARQRLWWVDIEKRELHCWNPETRQDQAWDFPQEVGFAVPTAAGDLVMGIGRTLARFSPETASLTIVKEPEGELPENRFNDAKCDPAGRLWAGTMAISERPALGSLYRIDAGWQITRMLTEVSISNGLAWATDGRTMYYIDSPTRRVDAFDFDPATGTLANRRAIIEIDAGFPDGMCIDQAGNLWVALWGGWSVACFDPRTGAQLARIEVPVEAVSSCCFGGPQLDQLFITTANRDLDAAGRAAQPLAGAIFLASVGTRGFPGELFAG